MIRRLVIGLAILGVLALAALELATERRVARVAIMVSSRKPAIRGCQRRASGSHTERSVRF